MTRFMVAFDSYSLGEFSSRLMQIFAMHKEIEIEKEDFSVIAEAALLTALDMHEQAEFANSVWKGIESLPTTEDEEEIT